MNVLYAHLLAAVEDDKRPEIRALMTPLAGPVAVPASLPHKPGTRVPDWWGTPEENAREALAVRDWLLSGRAS